MRTVVSVRGIGLAAAVAFLGGGVQAAEGPVEHVRHFLSPAAAERRADETFAWQIRLPEHVRWVAGSRAVLAFRTPSGASNAPATLTLRLNGQTLPTPSFTVTAADDSLRVQVPLPEAPLPRGWNQIAVQATFAGEVAGGAVVDRCASYLELAFERVPLFPEWPRFPHSLAEERLLAAPTCEPTPPSDIEPTVTLLLPSERRDVLLRGAALLGARLGQTEYLAEADCRVGTLADWAGETNRNALVVGRWDELSHLPPLANLAEHGAGLAAGEGLLAELILGELPHQCRWLVVSGRDDRGLEHALLTLGSTPALAALPPSPARIERAPAFAAGLEEPAGGPRATDLRQVREFLLRDPCLREAAFLVPAEASLDDVRVLFGLAFVTGKRLPASPVLWPEAAGYARDRAPAAERLAGRSVLLVGSLAQWNDALPAGARRALVMDPAGGDRVRVQGRWHPVSTFEPTLAFLEMFPSPWSGDQTLVAAGGWHGLAGPVLRRMLFEPEAAGRVYGNVAAMDALGRAAAYDTRRGAVESLAEHLQRFVPAGLGVAETKQRLALREAQVRKSAQINWWLLLLTPALLLGLVSVRVWLLWEQARRRKQAMREEKPLGATP